MSNANMGELVMKFYPKFKQYLAYYAGIDKVWIDENGTLFSKMSNGDIDNCGYVSEYYYAKDQGYEGSLEDWAALVHEAVLTNRLSYDSENQVLKNTIDGHIYDIADLAPVNNPRLTGNATVDGSAILTAADRGIANGIAELDNAGKVPAAQLPSYVDDVEEYQDLAHFPQTGETGKIYVALDTNKTYRWSGSTYIEISNATDVLDDQAGAGVTDKTWSADKIVDTLDKDVTYVTPEMFGAKGDGSTDDTTALQNCINYARTNSLSVKGYKEYEITSSITISGNYLDIDIASITYTGESYAVILSGSYSSVKINRLYCSNGKGLLMRRTSSTNCRANRITMNRLFAKGHAVDFETNNYFILYNTFDIRYIKSDTGDCYHCDGHVGENVFMNSSCSCENGWAIYQANGRYYNFTLEADVLNGIYMSGGSSLFSGFRIREMVDKLVARINGHGQDERGGTLIKYVGPNYETGMISKFISEDFVPYEAIDVSELNTIQDIIEESSSYLADRLDKLAFYQIIDAPIRIGNWYTENGYTAPGKGMIVVGGKKICIPAHETVYTITDTDYDMRDAKIALNEAKVFPTRMIIGVDNCVIHLNSSYCPYGYSEFIVDQTQGHFCTIYDSKDSVNPIFNGSLLGVGAYKLHAYCNISENAITENTIYTDFNYNDGSNYIWDIIKVDKIGRNYVTPEDYGAIGDGTTDDSQAVQNACNAGYAVYFASNKTYYLESTVTINHDCYLYGGENSKIITKTPTGDKAPNGIIVSGVLKKTTTLTTDYTSNGDTDNCNNKFTLSDMTNIAIGDIMVITATDQYYSYARQYYYLGASLLITDVYDGHIYTAHGMPWDIENTANVSVKIYNAPTAIVENLTFVSDLDSVPSYRYLLGLQHCKNSTVRDCTFTQMANGLEIFCCVNTNVNCVSLSKSKWDNAIVSDGYGMRIDSSTNTVIERVIATCAQHAITISGNIPTIDTFIRNCNITAECRNPGLNMHECSYNLVVEDSTLGSIDMNGTVTLNRCKILSNKRSGSGDATVPVYGSHNPEWAKFRIMNTDFESGIAINVKQTYPQNPIQAFDSVIGSLEIINCTGGWLDYRPSTSETILSNTLQRIIIHNWQNCNRIYHNGSRIDLFEITESSFTHYNMLINENGSGHSPFEGIKKFIIKSSYPQMNRLVVNETHGEPYYLPENIDINFSSSDSSAHYVVCGENIASNNVDDYLIGFVGGSIGQSLTRSVDNSFSSALSTNGNGEIVFTQPNNTSTAYIYPKCLMYVKESSRVRMSVKLKNTGNTNGSSFRTYLAIVDAKTGLITYKNNGQSGQASTNGTVITHDREVPADSIVMVYYYCYSAVSNSQTTFSECVAKIIPKVFDDVLTYVPYDGVSRTGDGTLKSVSGLNNIAANSSAPTEIWFKADLLSCDSSVSSISNFQAMINSYYGS